jgi:hypothetical protein
MLGRAWSGALRLEPLGEQPSRQCGDEEDEQSPSLERITQSYACGRRASSSLPPKRKAVCGH